jgi:hypothetical protein
MKKAWQEQQIDIDKALLDPASVFKNPEEVLDHPKLATEQKIEVLRRWEHDALEISTAVEEGMPDGENDILRRILIALEQLSGSQTQRPSSGKCR